MGHQIVSRLSELTFPWSSCVSQRNSNIGVSMFFGVFTALLNEALTHANPGVDARRGVFTVRRKSSITSLCFSGKGRGFLFCLYSRERMVMSQYKTTVPRPPAPPTPHIQGNPGVSSSSFSSEGLGGGGGWGGGEGLCHSSSVQMDRVREYPVHKSPPKDWFGDHLTVYLQHC